VVRHLTIYTMDKSRSTHSEPMSMIECGGPKATAFFAKQATQCLTHCEWGHSPHIKNINPPVVAKR
jgi:hypothetical protein